MSDIKSSTSFHGNNYSYPIKIDNDLPQNKISEPTPVNEAQAKRTMQETAPEVKNVCDQLFNKIEGKQSKSGLVDQVVKNQGVFKLDSIRISGLNISFNEYILQHFQENPIDFEDFEREYRRIAHELNDKNLFTDAEGNHVKFTEEELNQHLDTLDYKNKFTAIYKVEIEEEKTEEEKKEVSEDKSTQSQDYQFNHLKTHKTSRYSPEDLKSVKNKVLLHILSSFNRAQLEIRLERSRIKKEQMLELADEIKRLTIKLKEMRLEETHEEIVNYSINQTQLDQDQLKAQLLKVRSFLTPLQQFSRASGGLKLIQVEGDAASPLRAKVVREFNLESVLQRKSREFSLLHITR